MNLLTPAGLELEVRPAALEDIPLLLAFIQSMAEFEHLPVQATPETLRASLFGPTPAAQALLVYTAGRPVGYIVYFFTFATMTGKRGLWLDDLFIIPEYRAHGLGKTLMAYLADLAIHNDCARFEWMVLGWNSPALDFYQGLGAAVLEDWRICRLDRDEIARLASTPPASSKEA
jgi:GNAT superfamily N-acetyltransferase